MKFNVSKKNLAKTVSVVRRMKLINRRINLNKKIITDWKLCAIRKEKSLEDYNNELNFYMQMRRDTAFYLCERNRIDRINAMSMRNLQNQRDTLLGQITTIHRAVDRKVMRNNYLRSKFWDGRSLARKQLGCPRYPTPKPKDDVYNQAGDPRYELEYPRHFDNYLRCWLPDKLQHVRYYEKYPEVSISSTIIINPEEIAENEDTEDTASHFSDVTDYSVDERQGYFRVDEMEMIERGINREPEVINMSSDESEDEGETPFMLFSSTMKILTTTLVNRCMKDPMKSLMQIVKKLRILLVRISLKKNDNDVFILRYKRSLWMTSFQRMLK